MPIVRKSQKIEQIIPKSWKKARNSRPNTKNYSKRENLNLPCVEGTNEKLRCILISDKICFLYWKHFRKLLWDPKDRVAKEDKNNIAYEIGCSNCKAAYYFGESKRSLKSYSD